MVRDADADAKPGQSQTTSRVTRALKPSGSLLLLCGVSLAFLAGPAQAAPGDPDPSFSMDGKLMTDFAGSFDRADGVVVQPNGRIVAAGLFENSLGKKYFGVARYGGRGALDDTFSADGKQITTFGGERAEATSVALQPDGKIVVAGITQGGSSATLNFAVARYTPTGALDSTFSGDGKQTTDFAGNLDEADSVALQADGKIVVAGRTRNAGTFNFAIARYTPTGTLDTTFSGDGKQRTDFDGDLDEAESVALQADGKIVVAGQTRSSLGNANFGIARYKTNGGLDETFSGDGKLGTDFAGAFDEAEGIALQPNGRIVVAGRAAAGTNDNFAVARYTPSGALDDTFSGDGKRTTDFSGGNEVAHGVALQSDGRIVAAGVAQSSSGNYNFGAARYTSSGALDNSFSGNGKVLTDFAGGADAGLSVALQSNGKIVVAGGASTGSPPNGNFGIARYLGG